MLLALDSIYKLIAHQMDVKMTFLSGDLDKEVYMEQLKGLYFLEMRRKFAN